MSPTDRRHNTVAGYMAHRRDHEPACEPCLRAKRRYEKNRLIHGPRTVPALGTQRRVQALRALGHTLRDICIAGGWTDKSSLNYALAADTITATTAARIAEVYERLSMTPPTGPKANRVRILAARQGWVPPLAWDDIDHDDEPATGADQADVDWVVVERILAGDASVVASMTTAERHAVTDAWLDTGRTWNDLERLTGWKHGRYGRTRPGHREAAA